MSSVRSDGVGARAIDRDDALRVVIRDVRARGVRALGERGDGALDGARISRVVRELRHRNVWGGVRADRVRDERERRGAAKRVRVVHRVERVLPDRSSAFHSTFDAWRLFHRSRGWYRGWMVVRSRILELFAPEGDARGVFREISDLRARARPGVVRAVKRRSGRAAERGGEFDRISRVFDG